MRIWNSCARFPLFLCVLVAFGLPLSCKKRDFSEGGALPLDVGPFADARPGTTLLGSRDEVRGQLSALQAQGEALAVESLTPQKAGEAVHKLAGDYLRSQGFDVQPPANGGGSVFVPQVDAGRGRFPVTMTFEFRSLRAPSAPLERLVVQVEMNWPGATGLPEAWRVAGTRADLIRLMAADAIAGVDSSFVEAAPKLTEAGILPERLSAGYLGAAEQAAMWRAAQEANTLTADWQLRPEFRSAFEDLSPEVRRTIETRFSSQQIGALREFQNKRASGSPLVTDMDVLRENLERLRGRTGLSATDAAALGRLIERLPRR